MDFSYEIKRRLEAYNTIKAAMETHMNSHKNESFEGLKCSQCSGPFFLFGGWTDIRHPLCLKCWTLHQKTLWDMQEQNMRGINFALSEMEDASGMPRGFFGRCAISRPSPTTVMGDLTLNNIKIDRSAIGVLNTGSILGSVEHIDASIDALNKELITQSFQDALKGFTEAVLKSNEASTEQKEAILELMSALVDEARQPKQKRRLSVAKNLQKNIQELASTIGSLHTIWQTVQPLISGLFS